MDCCKIRVVNELVLDRTICWICTHTNYVSKYTHVSGIESLNFQMPKSHTCYAVDLVLHHVMPGRERCGGGVDEYNIMFE